jgi:hypothetical protein
MNLMKIDVLLSHDQDPLYVMDNCELRDKLLEDYPTNICSQPIHQYTAPCPKSNGYWQLVNYIDVFYWLHVPTNIYIGVKFDVKI